jgi:hypothetical protein
LQIDRKSIFVYRNQDFRTELCINLGFASGTAGSMGALQGGCLRICIVATLLAMMVCSVRAAPDATEVACVVPISTIPGQVVELRDLPGAKVLVGTTAGLFLVKGLDGRAAIEPVGQVGEVFQLIDLTGVGVLVNARSGWFIFRTDSDDVKPIVADTGDVWDAQPLTGAGVLIGAQKGFFLARAVQGGASITLIEERHDDFAPLRMHDFPGVGLLIRTNVGLFVARAVDGLVEIERVSGVDKTGSIYSLPGAGMLFPTGDGWFLARAESNRVSAVRVAGMEKVPGWPVVKIPGVGVMIWDPPGRWIVARAANGLAIVETASGNDIGQAHDTRPLPAPLSGLLIGAEEGLFVARLEQGRTKIEAATGAVTGPVLQFAGPPGSETVIRAANGYFVATITDKGASLESLGIEIAEGASLLDFPGGGVLIKNSDSLFLVHLVNGAADIKLVARVDHGSFEELIDLPETGAVIFSNDDNNKRLYVAVSTSPLSEAKFDIANRKSLDGSAIDLKREISLRVTISKHACAAVADRLDLKVVVTPPRERARAPMETKFVPGEIADLSFPLLIDKVGEWKFELRSTFGGIERPMGEAQYLTFTGETWLERWWKILASLVAGVLVVANLALFLLARRSAWAWRLATDDTWGTGVLRVATLLLSHFPKAQLWILDLYFQRVRTKLKEPRPFLPVPLTGPDGSLRPSSDVIVPPWSERRLWLQGSSGMGKTTLFRNITESHFRAHETAFAAYAKWGCIVVAFPARDFAGSGEDKDDPTWVIDAVRATLSSTGLTFSSDTLLSRFLESGTLGIAIDGLNEVDRTRAVAAFSRRFSGAPMLVTSQQIADDRFIRWRLPADIRAFTLELFKLYLPPDQAETLFQRINASGLKDAIRSGYDVRLIIDLARVNPARTPLPANRMGLYAAVIETGWPDGTEEARKEQQSSTMAAAWRMVSERKPNEDMRRLRPRADLPADLLEALADAPEKENKPVRLLRRAGGDAFEFVHDQMHAYLAARWFAQDGLSPVELERMVSDSTIWTQSPDARWTLWNFAAALLDDQRLTALWTRVEDKEDWDVLRRALKAEAERRGLKQQQQARRGRTKPAGANILQRHRKRARKS